MSDNFLRFIPADPTQVPTPDQQASELETLRNWAADAEQVTAMVSESVRFVDPGANFERVACPACGTEMTIADWQAAMDRAAMTEFSDLAIPMPCCDASKSLNDLRYEMPAGFARFVLQAMNPGIRDLTVEQHARLEDGLDPTTA